MKRPAIVPDRNDRGLPSRGARSVACRPRRRTTRADTVVNLPTMNRNRLRRVDPDSHLVSLHSEYRHRDVVADHQRLADSSCENEHRVLLGRRMQPTALSRRDATRHHDLSKHPNSSGLSGRYGACASAPAARVETAQSAETSEITGGTGAYGGRAFGLRPSSPKSTDSGRRGRENSIRAPRDRIGCLREHASSRHRPRGARIPMNRVASTVPGRAKGTPRDGRSSSSTVRKLNLFGINKLIGAENPCHYIPVRDAILDGNA